jgi:hypothetical protein
MKKFDDVSGKIIFKHAKNMQSRCQQTVYPEQQWIYRPRGQRDLGRHGKR